MVMPSANTIIVFMLSALALNIWPGPSILFILSRCMGQGRRAGVVSAFGLATASLIQAVAAALGLTTLFLYSPLAFEILKYLGAAYLIYLGIRGFLRGGIAGVAGSPTRKREPSLAVVYWQGVLTDLLNPKLLLFFFAFLPQFVDPTIGEPRSQMLFLGLLFQVTALVRRVYRQAHCANSKSGCRLLGSAHLSMVRVLVIKQANQFSAAPTKPALVRGRSVRRSMMRG